MWDNIKDYIDIKDCEDYGLYIIKARNFHLGLFSKKSNSFYGIRSKFGAKFIDQEFHWDTGPPYGTAKPIKLLEIPNLNFNEYDEMFIFLEKKTIEYQIDSDFINNLYEINI